MATGLVFHLGPEETDEGIEVSQRRRAATSQQAAYMRERVFGQNMPDREYFLFIRKRAY
jgi:hypothetical protein